MSAMRCAIVGAGPAGFYAAAAAARRRASRSTCSTRCRRRSASCAPASRPTTRRSRRSRASTRRRRAHPGLRFFGGVELGARRRARRPARALPRGRLRVRHRRATAGSGSPARTCRARTPRPSSSPGTTATRTSPTTRSTCRRERAVVIGNGNVAIDVARMLVLDRDELAPDRHRRPRARRAAGGVASGGRACSAAAGRRRPRSRTPSCASSASSTRADVVVEPAELRLDDESAAWLESDDATATARRNVAMLREYAQRAGAGQARHRIVLRFLRSPVEIVGDEHGAVSGLRVARNRVERRQDGSPARGGDRRARDDRLRPRAPLDRLPRQRRSRDPVRRAPRAHPQRRRARLRRGGRALRGEYAVGWIKRGPSGVIGTNKKDAADTVARIVEDRDAGEAQRAADRRSARRRDVAARRSRPGSSRGTGWERDRRARARGRRARRASAREARADGAAPRVRRIGLAVADGAFRYGYRRCYAGPPNGAHARTPRAVLAAQAPEEN